jgi:hypothetical protein
VKPGFLDTIEAKRTGGFDRDGRPLWRVIRPLLYQSVLFPQRLLVTLPGFITNYASVPRAPLLYWWYGDRCWEEPAGHDQPYTLRRLVWGRFDAAGELVIEHDPDPIERRLADELFYEALLLNPRMKSSALAMYKAVRWWGERSWLDETNIPQPEAIRRLILPAGRDAQQAAMQEAP